MRPTSKVCSKNICRIPSSVPPVWQQYFRELTAGNGEVLAAPRRPKFKPTSVFNPSGQVCRRAKPISLPNYSSTASISSWSAIASTVTWRPSSIRSASPREIRCR